MTKILLIIKKTVIRLGQFVPFRLHVEFRANVCLGTQKFPYLKSLPVIEF